MSTLILMPGLDGTGDLFLPFLKSLKNGCLTRTVRYPTDIRQDYDGLSDHASSFLPTDGPCFLLAESFSGPVAIRLAHQYPDRVKGLILCSTFCRNPHPCLSVGKRFLDWLPVGSLARIGASFWLLGAFGTPELRASLHGVITQLPGPILRQRMEAILTVNVQKQLAALPMPILELIGSHDRIVSPIPWPTAMRSSGQVQIRLLNAPHLLLQTAPEQAANIVEDFMAKVLP